MKKELRVKKILSKKIEDGKPCFEVEWERSWEDEDSLLQLAPDLLKEFQSCDEEKEVPSSQAVMESPSKACDEKKEEVPKPKKKGAGILSIISRLKKNQNEETRNEPSIFDSQPVEDDVGTGETPGQQTEPTLADQAHQPNFYPPPPTSSRGAPPPYTPPRFNCSMCGEIFNDITKYHEHMYMHEQVSLLRNDPPKLLPPGTYQCKFCQATFDDTHKLKTHYELNHGPQHYHEVQTVNTCEIFHCGQCDMSFVDYAKLKSHVISQHPTGPLANGEQPPATPPSQQMTLDFKPVNEALLSNSMKTFRCNLCDEIFDTEDARAKHSLIHVDRSNAYDCPVCGKQFRHKTNLATHMAVHSGVKPHQCHVCLRRFTQKVNLQRHMQIHDSDRPFACGLCFKSFKQRAALEKHLALHANASYMCQTCSRWFGSRTNLQRHMLVHVTAGNQCYICTQNFTTTDNLERHFGEHIEEPTPQVAPPFFQQPTAQQQQTTPPRPQEFDNTTVLNDMQSHQKREEVVPEDGCPLQCGVCGVIFMSMVSLQEHMAIHTSNAIIKIEGKPVLASTPVFVAPQPPPPVPAQHFEEKPPPVMEIKMERQEAGTPPDSALVAKCESCQDLFPTHEIMARHAAIAHKPSNSDEEDEDEMEEGDEIAEQKNEEDLSLVTEDEEHMIIDNAEFIKNNIQGGAVEYNSKGRYEHGNYVCKICSRTMQYKYSLQKHMLIHTGAYSYKCHLCSKRFNHKSNLDKHLITHSGEKPHVCHLCCRAFSQRSNLQRHQLTHTQNRDFVCEVCGKRFNHMASLKTHTLIHTGAKPFSCYVCTKSFNQKGNLKRHMETHRSGKRNRKEKVEELNGSYLTQSVQDSFYLQEQQEFTKVMPEKLEASVKRNQEDPTTMLDESVKTDEEFDETTFHDSEEILTVVPSDELPPTPPASSPTPKIKKDGFKCKSCSKNYASAEALETHRLSQHSEIVCDVCGKHFSQKANLLKHKLIHMNKKPFPCKVCDKAFRQKANLQRHEMIHNKERKAVECDVCRKSFRCLWSLKQHMKSHVQQPKDIPIILQTNNNEAIMTPTNGVIIPMGPVVFEQRDV